MPEWWIKEYGENWRDWSNSDLMAEGYPPHDENGDPYELHHIGQWTDSPLAELTWAQHREGEFLYSSQFGRLFGHRPECIRKRKKRTLDSKIWDVE